MKTPLLVSAALIAPCAASAQGALIPDLPPGSVPPTLAETRQAMGIPSTGELRGQKDAVGFASRADQMAKVWELSGTAPAPELLGPKPPPGVSGLICPHDDYILAGRMYRQAVPLVTARTVVLVGVFHRHRLYNASDLLVFDPYRAWRAPDGDIRVSGLRDEVMIRLAPADYVRSAAWHDSEHSLEAIAYWLKHLNPEVEILPVIIPAVTFERLRFLAGHFGKALAGAMKSRQLALGADVSVVISSDGTHYGPAYHYTPYGDGGAEAYREAMERDRRMLKGLLAGEVTEAMARGFFAIMTDPCRPDQFRDSWCGRFSIPFGLLALQAASRDLGLDPPVGMPLAFGSSLSAPELPLQPLGLGHTYHANLNHFVSFPSVAYVN